MLYNKQLKGISNSIKKNQPLPKLNIDSNLQAFVDDLKAIPFSYNTLNDFLFEYGTDVVDRSQEIFNGMTQNTFSILNSYSFNPKQIIRIDPTNNQPICRPCLNVFSKAYFTYFKTNEEVLKVSESLFQYVIPFKEPIPDFINEIGEIDIFFKSDNPTHNDEKFIVLHDYHPQIHPFVKDFNGNYVLNMNSIDFDEIFYEEGKALLVGSSLSEAFANAISIAVGEYLVAEQSMKMLDLITQNQDLEFSLALEETTNIASKVANGKENLSIDTCEELGKSALIGVSFLKENTIPYIVSDFCEKMFKSNLILPLQSLIQGLVSNKAIHSKTPINISSMGELRKNNYSFTNITQDSDGFLMDVSFLWDIQKFFEIQSEALLRDALIPMEDTTLGISHVFELEQNGDITFLMGNDANTNIEIKYSQIPFENKYKIVGLEYRLSGSDNTIPKVNDLNLLSNLVLEKQEGGFLAEMFTIALYDNFKNNLDISFSDALIYNLNVFGLNAIAEQARIKMEDVANDLNSFDIYPEKDVGDVIMQPTQELLHDIEKDIEIVDQATTQIATDTEIITEMQVKELGTPYSKDDYKIDQGIIPPKDNLETIDIVDISEKGVEKFDQKIFDESYNRINQNAQVIDKKLDQIDKSIGNAENELAKAKEDAITLLQSTSGDTKAKKPSKLDRNRLLEKFESIENDLARLRQAGQKTRDNLGQLVPDDRLMSKLDKFRISKITKKMESANIAKVFLKFLAGTSLVLGSYYLFFRPKKQIDQTTHWDR